MLTCEFLNVINNEHIYRLIEVDEIGNLIGAHSRRILILKETSSNIQHTGARIALLDLDANCLNEVCLTNTS